MSVSEPSDEAAGAAHLQTILSLIQSLTKVDERKLQHVDRDPLIAGLLQFREIMFDHEEEIKYWFGSTLHLDLEFDTATPKQDPRALFGQCLTILYNRLSTHLSSLKTKVADQFIILSVPEIKMISGSLQFYIVSQCLPYLDEGVGIDIRKRSKFIKMWTRKVKSSSVQCEQLIVAFKTLRSLMECNEAIEAHILKYHVQDVLAIYEQVRHISNSNGVELHVQEDVFHTVPKPILIPTIIGMLKAAPPSWLATALGKRLSDELMAEGGLRNIIDAYAELCDDMWGRAPLLGLIARQIATPPSCQPIGIYYENIIEQFIILTTVRVYPKPGLACLLSSFVQEVYIRSPPLCNSLIVDRLFLPWETIYNEKKESCELEKKHLSAITALSLLLDDKLMPRVLMECKRLPPLVPLLLDIVSSKIDNPVRAILTLRENAVKILIGTIDRIVNKGEFVMCLLRINSGSRFKVTSKSQKKWVEVIDPKKVTMSLDEDCPVMMEHEYTYEMEKLLISRLEALFTLPDVNRMAHMNIEILCEFMEMWMKSDDLDAEKAEDGDGTPKINFDCLASHVFGTIFFDRLITDMDTSNPHVIKSVTKFVTITFKCCVKTIRQLEEHQKKFDIVRRDHLDEVTDRATLYQIRIDSLKVALNLSSAIITTEALNDTFSDDVLGLAQQLIEVKNLETKSEDLKKIIRHAAELLDIMEVVRGGKPLTEAEPKKVKFPAKPERSGDLQDLLNVLSKVELTCPDALAIAGHSLLCLTQGVRNREEKYLEVIDRWILNIAKNFITHEDTYVSLNAVNLLTEIVNYAPKYLTHMLELIKTGEKEKELEAEIVEKNIILKINVGEAVSKVFKVMGSAATMYIDEAASVLIDEMQKGPDLTRASAFTCFSEIVLACRGRNIAKHFAFLNAAIMQGMSPSEPILIRRAAIFLCRQYLKSCGSDLVEICGPYLRDLRRTLVRIWEVDQDNVMRVHAQICIEEIQNCLKSNIEQTLSYQFKKVNM
ncbi:unnamed protein product [Auanema sp. JU1783]|nr:unnamed protein product [Auanema sp. JU1783]